MAKTLSTKERSVRTGVQAVLSLLVGLVVTVWSVQGVPSAVFNYLSSQTAVLFGTTGVAGLVIGYLMNKGKKQMGILTALLIAVIIALVVKVVLGLFDVTARYADVIAFLVGLLVFLSRINLF